MADEKKHAKNLGKIKSSVFSRGLTLARMTASTGAGLAAHRVANLFSSEDKKKSEWAQFLTTQAQNISQDLGELKGSLMKAGQMLSMYGEHFLPPEANRLLKSLQADSPPLAWEVVEKQLVQELGRERLSRLEIDQESIGTASLGQVHRARILETNEEIVLKVQYPGVEKAIESDLKALKSFFNLMKFVPKGKVTDQIFAEIREMLIQETDYEHEARQTNEYRDRLAGDTRFIVPRIYPEWSTRRVIASSYERGHRVDDGLIQNLSPARRNQLALNFLELYFKELFDWGVVQTDPHLGNYKVRLSPSGQDQWVLFDFGAVRAYPSSFLGSYLRMAKASLLNHPEELRAAALELRFLENGDDPELRKIFEEFCLMSVEPFLSPEDPRNENQRISASGEYDWKNSDLPQRLSRKGIEMIRRYDLRPPPREILFLDRKTGGVFILMSVLGAKVAARGLLLKYLSKSSTEGPQAKTTDPL